MASELIQGAPSLPSDAIESAVCQAIVYFHIYQDGLMWGRLQTLGLIQAATIGSEYALKKAPIHTHWSSALVIAVGIAGASLSLILLKIVRLDQYYRDINLPILAKILEKHNLQQLIFTEPSGIGWGGVLLQGMILLFTTLDLILGYAFVSGWIS